MSLNLVSIVEGPHPDGFTWISGKEKGALSLSPGISLINFFHLFISLVEKGSQSAEIRSLPQAKQIDLK